MNDKQIEMIKSIKNPKEFVINYAKNSNNLLLKNLVQETERGNYKFVEEFATNFLKEKGVNVEEILKLLK